MKLSNVNVDEYKAEYVANQIYCFLKSL
jgi:hypothetical protein